MSELTESGLLPWVIALLTILILWLVYRLRRGRGGRLDQVLNDIGYDRVDNLVVPNGDEGEILVDQLLLTSQGLLILEIKDVEGVVFGSDKMQDWTVIRSDKRFTFSNPLPGLYDRVAAVRQIVRQVPVDGRVLFLDGAEFSKGQPEHVATLDQLAEQFGEPDKKAAEVKIEAFLPHWELISKRANDDDRNEAG